MSVYILARLARLSTVASVRAAYTAMFMLAAKVQVQRFQ